MGAIWMDVCVCVCVFWKGCLFAVVVCVRGWVCVCVLEGLSVYCGCILCSTRSVPIASRGWWVSNGHQGPANKQTRRLVKHRLLLPGGGVPVLSERRSGKKAEQNKKIEQS